MEIMISISQSRINKTLILVVLCPTPQALVERPTIDQSMVTPWYSL
ncbi:MAG: hypothetical protein HWN51_07075 [Desulfobacterales bacterium]|nr:hypothetical protein [Desulfobacterales bacterium]